MKRLNELQSLINLSKALGQELNDSLLEEYQELSARQENLKKRIKESVAKDLAPLFEAPRHELDDEPPITEQIEEIEEIPKEEIEEPVVIVEELFQKKETVVDKVVKAIAESTLVNPEPALVPKPNDPLIKKVEQLEKWISRIAATGPGGGEVNLRWLDDVDRTNITDGQYLRYDGPTKKFTFDAGHHNNYYLAVQSTETQTSSATSATAMTFNVIDSNFGITITSNSHIVITNPGVYNLQFSSQFVNTGNESDPVYVWLRQNGANVPGSNGIVTIPAKDNANIPGKVISSWNYVIVTSSVSETIQLMWFAEDDTHVTMSYISSQAATATTPEIPATASVILTVTPIKVNSY